MNKVLLRFLGYVVAGMSIGGVGFYATHAPGAPLLPLAALGGGAVGLAGAVILLVKATASVAHSIRITPVAGLVAMDAIGCAAAAVAVFFALDGFDPIFTDPPVAAIIAVMYLPSAVLLAAVVTSSGNQSIRIDQIGLTILGPSENRTALWKDVEALAPDAQFIAVTRLGIPIPRRLRTNILVAFASGDKSSIFEPGLKSTRKYTLEQLRDFAPNRLSSDIETLAQEWV